MSRSLHIHNVDFEVTTIADELLFLKAEDALTPLIGQGILSLGLDFVSDVISTEHEICIKLKKSINFDELSKLKEATINLADQRKLKLPILLNKESKSVIETHTGYTYETYINRLLRQEFTVAMLGFLPGFIYLSGLPEDMHIQRMATPKTRILPHSLAVGGPYLGMYSLPSPGGWNVIGQFATSILDLTSDQPTLLKPGDRLSLEIINAQDFQISEDKTILDYNGLT